jgi:hypothetical protein
MNPMLQITQNLLEKMANIQGGPKHTPTNPPQDDKVQPVGNLENPFAHNIQHPSGFTGKNVGDPHTKSAPKGETNMRSGHLAAIPKDISAKVGPRSKSQTNNPYIKKVASDDHVMFGFFDEFANIVGRG